MRRVNPLLASWRTAVFFIIALLIVAADQLTKLWINLYSAGQVIFESGPFRIISVQNTGGAFGLFPGHSLVLTIAGCVGIVLVLLFMFVALRYVPVLDSWWSRIALGLILGGTVGNLIDRLRFGYVTDFVGIGIWPVFNVADSALTVGIFLFALFLIFFSTGRKEQLQSETTK